MKKISGVCFCFLGILSAVYNVNAAGTYYSVDDVYRTQRNYTYMSGRQNVNVDTVNNSNYYTSRNCMDNQSSCMPQQRQVKTVKQNNASSSAGKLHLTAGVSHEMAQWNFEMKNAGSNLNYGDLAWNVFNVGGNYNFDISGVKMGIDAGFRYGIQYGDSTMLDDDISNGGFVAGFIEGDYAVSGGSEPFQGYIIDHSVSVGTSNGGNLMEFNAGLNFVDLWQLGGVRLTPSVGYRYLKYKLETKRNKGMAIETIYDGNNYIIGAGDEIQYDPVLIFFDSVDPETMVYSNVMLYKRQNFDEGLFSAGVTGGSFVDSDGTWYFEQPGVSHSYETTWAGPYLALDMDYDINVNNSINARIEFGLPSYESTGDQPYRIDWQHPKSVEDNAGFGDAWHFGAGLNWLTAITDSVSLSLGMTFDYYSVSGADAKTYLNPEYYIGDYYYYYDRFNGTDGGAGGGDP